MASAPVTVGESSRARHLRDSMAIVHLDDEGISLTA